MVRERTNAIAIMEEDIESLLSEWERVPGWVKVHVSAKHPGHMSGNNVKWYEMLDGILAKRERHEPPASREGELVFAR